jgi:hypothetical protein
MDRYSRIVFVLLLVALSAFRLVRYIQLGTGKRRVSGIPGTSVPAIGSVAIPRSADIVPMTQPAGPISARRRALGTLAAVATWLALNGILWTALFGLQYLDGIPVFWRLFLGVLGNFYLIRVSRDIGKRVSAKSDTLLPPGNPLT